jgi:hypothetical protein
MRSLAQRYLAQDTALQTRARSYQDSTWHPETPEARARRQQLEEQRRREQEERNRQEMERIRESASGFLRKLEREETFRPINQPGGNIRSITDAPAVQQQNVARVLGVPYEAAKHAFQTMIADYDSTRFTMQITSTGGSVQVGYIGADGTSISRTFKKDDNGNLSVYHGYFSAGNRGAGSGKKFLRASMGVYKALGVKHIGVYANIDVGGYAWAKFGFLPTAWGSMRTELRNKVDRITASPEVKGKIRRLLDSPNPETLRIIANLEDNGRNIGKALLLGMNWNGRLDLGNQTTMQVFTAYVTQRRQP